MQATLSSLLRHVAAGDVHMAVVCDGGLCCDGDFFVRRLVIRCTQGILGKVGGMPLECLFATNTTIRCWHLW